MTSTQKILANLNPEQLRGVKDTQGPLLISAGAGSGKTRVLTHRIAYMIEHDNVQPYNILALTFTDNAAEVMKHRIIKLCGKIGHKVYASTFHSFGDDILRNYADKLGYSRKFSIARPSAQKTLIRHILKHLHVDTKTYSPSMVGGKISMFKNDLKTPTEAYQMCYANESKFNRIVGKVYVDYQHVLHANECIDFDDMLMMPVMLFEHYPNILEALQNKYRYISVDEYQDTNKAQYEMIRLLSDKYHNICVVGDADQSIYGWRGANPGNLIAFKHDNRDTKTIRMNHNYRSTKNILTAANSVIAYNHKEEQGNAKDKELYSDRPKGRRPLVYQAQTGEQEARYIAQTIQNEVKAHKMTYRDCAILYRSNAQSRVLEDTMLEYNIPYDIVGSIKFYERKEIKSTINYLALISNPKNEFALRSVINFPHRGIGEKTLRGLVLFADQNHLSMIDALGQINANNSTLGMGPCDKLGRFSEFLQSMIKYSATHSITDIVSKVLERNGYGAILEAQSRKLKNAKERLENLAEFKSVTHKWDQKYAPSADNLAAFVSHVMLRLNSDPTKGESDDTVKLMTIHASKGQEYGHVFLTGLEEDIFPTYRSHFDHGVMREERRLAYVAITRAKDELTLSYAKRRLLYGRVQRNEPSRFIGEIKPSILTFRKGPKVRAHRRPTRHDNDVFKNFF